jgi:hypothetical protein
VSDLLREKLHTIGGELVEARNRILELESNQIMEGNELKRSAASLSASSETLGE